MKVISTYSREDAIADGVLFRIPKNIALRGGFRGECVCSLSLYAAIKERAEDEARRSHGSVDTFIRLLTLKMMLNARRAIMESVNKGEQTNIVSFEETECGVSCFVQVEQEGIGKVVWTFMAKSDY